LVLYIKLLLFKVFKVELWIVDLIHLALYFPFIIERFFVIFKGYFSLNFGLMSDSINESL